MMLCNIVINLIMLHRGDRLTYSETPELNSNCKLQLLQNVPTAKESGKNRISKGIPSDDELEDAI